MSPKHALPAAGKLARAFVEFILKQDPMRVHVGSGGWAECCVGDWIAETAPDGRHNGQWVIDTLWDDFGSDGASTVRGSVPTRDYETLMDYLNRMHEDGTYQDVQTFICTTYAVEDPAAQQVQWSVVDQAPQGMTFRQLKPGQWYSMDGSTIWPGAGEVYGVAAKNGGATVFVVLGGAKGDINVVITPFDQPTNDSFKFYPIDNVSIAITRNKG